MHLLSLNLLRQSAINVSVYGNLSLIYFYIAIFMHLIIYNFQIGNFSGPKIQEIVVAKGNLLELLRPDDSGKYITVNSTPVFSVIRSLMPFRLSGNFNSYFKSKYTTYN